MTSIILQNFKWIYFISPSNHVRLKLSNEVVAPGKDRMGTASDTVASQISFKSQADFPKNRYNLKARFED